MASPDSDESRLLLPPPCRRFFHLRLQRPILSIIRAKPKPSSAAPPLRRRRRTPSIRLGGGRRRAMGRSQRRWGGAAVVIGLLRRIRLSRMLKRLTEAYRVAVAELMEAGPASMEKESHFVVPVMPVSVGFIG